jgi:hypothetical protein
VPKRAVSKLQQTASLFDHLVGAGSGIVRPIAFAILRLTTSSNFVGCSTGISFGLPIGLSSDPQHPDTPDPPALLRARRERPRDGCAAEQGDQVAALDA